MHNKDTVVTKDKNMRIIAIFAHNEANKIIACLESVKKAIRVGDECIVLNNGSTDNTGSLVEEFLKTNSFCRLVTIDVGDKANAWNVFMHELGIEADLFYFLDGDCEIAQNSLDALEKCFVITPIANAAAALPSDRVSLRNREEMIRVGGLAGNLYALPKQFVERLRKNKVYLPFGLIGDDSLVGALAYWDLNPKLDWDKTRIVICKDAEFSYVPLSPFSLRDIRLYYKRKIRYSLRYFQTRLMKRPLKDHGLAAIPKNIEDLYISYSSEVKITWRGIDTFFDYLAAKRIRRCIIERSNACL